MIKGKKLRSDSPFCTGLIFRPPILSPFPPPINSERSPGGDRIRLELVIRASYRFQAGSELLEARLMLVLS